MNTKTYYYKACRRGREGFSLHNEDGMFSVYEDDGNGYGDFVASFGFEADAKLFITAKVTKLDRESFDTFGSEVSTAVY